MSIVDVLYFSWSGVSVFGCALDGVLVFGCVGWSHGVWCSIVC